jgi:hypothetical protein
MRIVAAVADWLVRGETLRHEPARAE